MPVELVEYYHVWCEDCGFTYDDAGSYEDALEGLNAHTEEEH